MKRYSIIVREHGSDHDVVLCQVDSNPQPVVDALRAKTLTIKRTIFEPGSRSVKVPKYNLVRVVENTP